MSIHSFTFTHLLSTVLRGQLINIFPGMGNLYEAGGRIGLGQIEPRNYEVVALQ